VCYSGGGAALTCTDTYVNLTELSYRLELSYKL
jgi:hypothetical protein